MQYKAMKYLIAILLGTLFISLSAKEQKDKKTETTIEKTLKFEEVKWIREKNIKGWALGCAAALTERNHDRHDLLAGGGVNENNIRDKKELLGGSWGINSRAGLFDTLRQIEHGGHRKKFEDWGRSLQTLSEQKYQELLQKYQNNQELLQRIRIAKRHYEKLGSRSLLGWDYTRYICLCRWGYVVGYISEEEAWKKIIPVAKMLQKAFDSWEDLGRNYIIGRQFWSYEETKKTGYLFEDAYQRLLDMPSSPWNKYAWDMDLTDRKTVNGPNDANAGEQSDSE